MEGFVQGGVGLWIVLLALGCAQVAESPFVPAEIATTDAMAIDDTAPTDMDPDQPWQGLLDLPGYETADATAPDLPPVELPESPLCHGNGDGQIDADELPVTQAMGLVSTFTVAAGTVALPDPGIAGTFDADQGGFQWDLSHPLPGDDLHYEALLPVASFWFSDYFVNGQFVQSFSGDTVGIYHQDEDALWLHGIASAEDGPEASYLVYEYPIKLLSFPLKNGHNWSAQEIAADGLYEGELYPVDYGMAGTVSISHSYHFTVDKAGTASVPMGDFDVLRVYADVEMDVLNSMMPTPVVTQRIKLVYFVAECAGTVALVRSLDNEVEPEFTHAAEVKRLGLVQ